jgi:hypothetical protein
MIESSPMDQIAYGYGYDPQDYVPPSTLEFARDYYPFFRFGLALTLMSDGYFTHEFGDTWHGNDWWYDELNFNLGYPLGPAEKLDQGGAEVYQRRFTNGLVLLNASPDTQEIPVGSDYWRLIGSQAPRYDFILDDLDPQFSTTGTWNSVDYDSGELKANGPYYHCWDVTCHEHTGEASEARWDLQIQEPDVYTISTWWPAAPQAGSWSGNATYEVLVDGQVVASMALDQRAGGDEWHFVAEVPLSPGHENYVRLVCQGEAPCVADALHVRSRARYNDGSAVQTVTLQPMDGIVLSNFEWSESFLPFVMGK